jgi:Holliday junction DNA helicase RuvB
MTATVEAATGLRGDYLDDWKWFIGQEKIKQMLKIACRSAQLRNDRLEHLFFAGGGGLGKTTLAILCAFEMGRKPLVVSGSIEVNQFRLLLSDMRDGDVLIWDEFQGAVTGGRLDLSKHPT